VYAHLMHEYQGIVQEIVKLVLFLIYRTFYIYIYIVENNNRVDTAWRVAGFVHRGQIL
jgi:hypothetical protein